ncbi:unnamed protein product, partial [Symbiodinium microadriaticum]
MQKSVRWLCNILSVASTDKVGVFYSDNAKVSNEPETAPPTASQAEAPPASTVAPTNQDSELRHKEEPAAVPAEAPTQAEEEPGTMELEVIIPDGVKPGDVFEVEFDGKMVEEFRDKFAENYDKAKVLEQAKVQGAKRARATVSKEQAVAAKQLFQDQLQEHYKAAEAQFFLVELE